MRNIDYIIVGCGLAGIAFCETLRANNKTFIVFDDASQKSSIVAAGLYNPVILKRFTEVWKAKEQLSLALPLYAKIEKQLKIKVDFGLQILRRFSSIEEQNLWFNAMDKPKLEPFLSSQLVKNANPYIDAPHGFGEVLQAGRLDTETLITAYKAFLKDSNGIIEAPFDYNALQISSDFLQYDNLRATKIVFAEGFGVKNNPYFSYIPLNGTKGEVLTIKAPKLKIDFAIKSSVFVIPISDDLYTVGSTYAWDDKTNNSTEKARLELESKLKSFITCKYEVVNHLAGIRPTVNDRRPLIGQHPSYNNLFVLNGLGTRGVMIAPYVAKQLFEFIEKKHPLDKEISINRFVS